MWLGESVAIHNLGKRGGREEGGRERGGEEEKGGRERGGEEEKGGRRNTQLDAVSLAVPVHHHTLAFTSLLLKLA